MKLPQSPANVTNPKPCESTTVENTNQNILCWRLPFGKVSYWVDRLAQGADFEMQNLLITAVSAHFGNFLAGPNLVSLLHKTDPVVGVGAEHFFTMFNDDQFTVTNQAISTVNHLTS